MNKKPLAALVAASLFAGAWAGVGVMTAVAQDSAEKPPEFTEAYMTDPANITAGEEIWAEQCRHCHGYSAYPGKAPKLKPHRYKPKFVFDRVTDGFRKMPAWKEIYNREERMSVVAYIKSRQFSP
jgi:mono/diheme cytochrome c family protein